MTYKRILFALAVGAAIVVGGSKPDALFAPRILSLVSAPSGSAAVTNLQFSSFELSPSNKLVFGAEWPADTYFPNGGISVWTTGRIDMPSWRRFPQLVPVVSGASGMTFEMPRPLQLGGASSGFYRLAGDNYPTPSPPGDGGSIVGEPPRDWRTRYGLDPFRAIGGEDPDGDGKSNNEEYCEGTDPTDAASCGYQLPTTNTLSLAVSIGSDAAAWELEIKGNGPEDFGVRRLVMPKDLMWLTNTYEFCKGNSYTLTLHWINNDRLKNAGNAKCPWHCWEARVDGKPNVRTRENWTLERIPGVEEFIIGEGYIIDNRDGLLTDHVHKNSTNGVCEVYKDISATLYIEPFIDLTIDGKRHGVILIHESYSNDVDDIFGCTSTVSTVKVINRTPLYGTFDLSVIRPIQNMVRIYADSACDLCVSHGESFALSADSYSTNEFQVVGVDRSRSINDVSIQAVFNAFEVCATSSVDCTIARVQSFSKWVGPVNRSRHIFGVGELMTMRILPKIYMEFALSSFVTNGVMFDFEFPNSPGEYAAVCRVGSSELPLSYIVIAPNAELDFSKWAIADGADVWQRAGLAMPTNGMVGGGFWCCPRFAPDIVSFHALTIEEGIAVATDLTADYVAKTNPPDHDVSHGACKPCLVSVNNTLGMDKVLSPAEVAENHPVGGWTWDIPCKCYFKEKASATSISWSTNRFEYDVNGDCKIVKFGHVVIRGTNNAYRVCH